MKGGCEGYLYTRNENDSQAMEEKARHDPSKTVLNANDTSHPSVANAA